MREFAGITVDEKLYSELESRRYDVTEDWKNVPLKTVVMATESSDYESWPEARNKCLEIADQVKNEIRQYYSAKDGRREYKTMKHQNFNGYLEDVKSIQSDMASKAQKARETVEAAREKWKGLSDMDASESAKAAWKAEYLKAEDDFKASIAELNAEMNQRLDAVQAQLQEHVSDFYLPNGSRIDDGDLKLFTSFFPLSENEVDGLVAKHHDNPTMLRLIDQYAANNGVRTRTSASMSRAAVSGGKKAMESFAKIRSYVGAAVQERAPVPSYQGLFDRVVGEAAADLEALPVRPTGE